MFSDDDWSHNPNPSKLNMSDDASDTTEKTLGAKRCFVLVVGVEQK